MDCKKIGEYIQTKRKAKGLTQAQLSEMLGITSKAVSKWETGVAIPDIALFPELTKILNITIDELLVGEDIIKNEKKKRISLNIILSIIVLLLIISLTSVVIYFKTNYSKVKVYKIESANSEFFVDGTLTTIDDKSYLSISSIDYLGTQLDLFEEVKDFKYEIYYGEELLFSDEIKEPASKFYLKDFVLEFLSSTDVYNKTGFDNGKFIIDDYCLIKFSYVDVLGNEQILDLNLKIIFV